MARLLDHAIAFAQTVLRADAATNLGKGIGRLTDIIGFLEAPCCCQPEPVGNIVMKRTMRLAVWNATLATPARLLGSFNFSILGIDFVKVLTACLCRTLFRHVAIDSNKSEHRWLGHSVDPWLSECWTHCIRESQTN